MLHRLVCTAALVLVVASGCGDGLGDCDPALPICDVNDADCQKQIYEATACQRNQRAGSMPTIRKITSEEFAGELQSDGPAEGTPKGPWDITLGLLGLIAADSEPGQASNEALVEGVLGFYDTRTRLVTLLSDATGLGERTKVLVLSHEFVHVLQDRGGDFRRLAGARTSDQVMANDALSEGEATVYSNLALAAGDGASAGDLDWEAYFDDMLDGVFSAVDGSRSPFIAFSLQSPYAVGGAPIADAYLDGSAGAVKALYRSDRIRSVADWQRGYPDAVDSPRPQLSCASPVAPEGYDSAGQDVLGVGGITALWSAQGAGAAAGWAQGRKWRGGTSWVWGKVAGEDEPPAGSVMVWQTRWAGEKAAAAVATLLEDSDLWVYTEGDQAIIVATDDPSLLDWADAGVASWFDCPEVNAKNLSGVRSRQLPRDPRKYSLRRDF